MVFGTVATLLLELGRRLMNTAMARGAGDAEADSGWSDSDEDGDELLAATAFPGLVAEQSMDEQIVSLVFRKGSQVSARDDSWWEACGGDTHTYHALARSHVVVVLRLSTHWLWCCD